MPMTCADATRSYIKMFNALADSDAPPSDLVARAALGADHLCCLLERGVAGLGLGTDFEQVDDDNMVFEHCEELRKRATRMCIEEVTAIVALDEEKRVEFDDLVHLLARDLWLPDDLPVGRLTSALAHYVLTPDQHMLIRLLEAGEGNEESDAFSRSLWGALSAHETPERALWARSLIARLVESSSLVDTEEGHAVAWAAAYDASFGEMQT